MQLSEIAGTTQAVFEPTLLKVVTSGLLIIFNFLFGDLYNDALIAIVMLVILDTITGVWASKYEGHTLTSQRFFSGWVKKVFIFCIAISSAYYLDTTIPGSYAQYTVIGFIAVNEFMSIVENLGRLGYKTPQRLLNQLKDFK